MDFKRNLTAFLVHDFEMESNRKEVSAPHIMHHQRQHQNNFNGEDGHKRPPSTIIEEGSLQNFSNCAEMEAVLVEDLVKPLIFLFRYFLPFHDTINFDPVARCCVLVKGSIIRKLCCIVWQLLVIYRLGVKAIPSLNQENGSESGNASSDGISTLAKGAYLTFITFSCITFCVYWLSTRKACAIFNHVITLAEKLHLKDQSPKRIIVVKASVHASWIFTALYVFATVIIYTIITVSPPIGTKTEMVEDATSQSPLNSTLQGRGSGYQLDFTDIHVSNDFMLIQIIGTASSFMNIFSWMMSYLHMSCWAWFFRQLISIFYWRLHAKRELGQNLHIPNEIRTFNKIGSIIDEFNQMYGLAMLFGAVVCVTYISPSVKHAFSGLSNPLQISSGWHLLLSYIPMIATSFVMAEVQRMASLFAGIIKDEYGRFTKECGDPAESLCGIAIIHYDLATSNVGLKGIGFFTVSYQFITTIVSVIISYSILVVQMFPHDNSDIEV